MSFCDGCFYQNGKKKLDILTYEGEWVVENGLILQCFLVSIFVMFEVR